MLINRGYFCNFAIMEQPIINIIVAAGSGSRFGASLPKQFCLLNDRPVLMHTIEHMRLAMPHSRIIVVLSGDFVDYWAELCQSHNFISPDIVTGGDSRWKSVKNALDAVASDVTPETIITVHDGARPIVDPKMATRVIDAARQHSGAIPAIAVTDSLRMIENNGNSHPVDRALFRAVQTPQAFNGQQLLEAYSLPYQSDFTDDASVMTAAHFDDIVLVEGSPSNIKITHPSDIEIAKIYLNQQ